jgi:hypothetical protein
LVVDAHASVTVYAVWYPNGDNSPPQVAQNGATIGGWFYLRLRVQPQSGYIISASVTQSTLAEQTDVHPVTPTSPTFQSTQPNPAYGDPTDNVVVLQSQQNLADRHNGQYRLDVTVQYTVSTGNPPPNDRQTFTEVASFTFNVLNLLLVDSRTEPYFVWKPDEMSGVVFSAQLQHAQAGTCTVKVEIFRSDDNQNAVVVKEFANVSRPGTWSWTWDGRLDDGTVAPAGVYVYRLGAYVYSSAPPDRDSNRSDYLSLRYTSQAGEAQYRGLQGSEAQFLIRYHIASDRPASEGKVVVFAPDLNPIYERTLTGDDLNPADHIVVVSVPVDRLSKPSEYLFLICVKDNHADVDRSHRRLWALPLTLAFAYKQVKLTDPPLVEGSPMLFRGLPMPCPVLIKGEVLPGEQGVRPNIVLTVEKGYLDENGVWHVVEEERPVPETELDWNPEEDVWWDNQSGVWRFRMVWNQQLPRTQFSPYLERYRLRAYALCNRSDSTAVADFRVMSMAKPIDCPITSDYTEGNRPLPEMKLYVCIDESQAWIVPVFVPGTEHGGYHLAIDYAKLDRSTAGMQVNSAEAGKVEEHVLPIPAGGLSIMPDRGVAYDIWQKSREHIGQGYTVWVYCLLTDARPNHLRNRESYIGGHRIMQHGKVNLRLKNKSGFSLSDQYERDEASSAYGHTSVSSQNLPAVGSQLDISTLLTRVQDFYEADQAFKIESMQLSLGYLEFDNALVYMVCRKGSILRSFRWRTTVRVPSSAGPHLHFEVRLASKIDSFDQTSGQWIDQDGDGVIRTWGQVNPAHYLGLQFGER